MTLLLAVVLLISGCSRSAPGTLGEAGWYDARQSDRTTVGKLLHNASTDSSTASYHMVLRNDDDLLDITRLGGVTRYRFEVIRDSRPVALEVFQYDPGDSLHFPRSVVCGPDRSGYLRCRDVTLDVIGDYLTEEPLEEDFHGIEFGTIFAHTHNGVHSPAHWRTLSALAHTPLNLLRNGESGMIRLGLDDRVYVVARTRTPAGEAICVAWFDSVDEVPDSNPRGGWCQRDGVWLGGIGDAELVELTDAPKHLVFPAPVELPANTNRLARHAGRIAELALPEFPRGFLDTLRQEPRLP